jgi:DNA-directed RNA polymerase beta' subunit
MNIAHSIPSSVSSISFSFLSTEDIKRISVKQILNPVLLDDLNRPNIGGLYDPALGPSDRQDMYVSSITLLIRSLLNIPFSCATCRLTYFTCPGHFGHIELPSPVFHPLFMINMFNLLRGTCLFCHRFKLSRSVVCYFRQGTWEVVTKLFRRYANILPSFVYWNMASWMLLKGWMIFGD